MIDEKGIYLSLPSGLLQVPQPKSCRNQDKKSSISHLPESPPYPFFSGLYAHAPRPFERLFQRLPLQALPDRAAARSLLIHTMGMDYLREGNAPTGRVLFNFDRNLIRSGESSTGSVIVNFNGNFPKPLLAFLIYYSRESDWK